MYASGITYTGVSSASPAAGTLTGADNGLSVSGADAVLGQDVGAAGDPAALLNAREIPMKTFQMNWRGGSTVLSPAAQISAGGRLEVYETLAAGTTENVELVSANSTAAGSQPTLLHLDATVTGPVTIATPGAYLSMAINGVQTFFMAYDGQTFFKNSTSGVTYLAISDAQEVFGPAGGQAIIQIEPVYNLSIPFGTANDIFLNGSFTVAGSTAALTQILMVPRVNQTAGGTGAIIGIDFAPSITSVTGQLIAYRNLVGDVLLQANATTGRTGVHNNSTLTAWLHVGPGLAAAGSAPFKLTSGTNLTTPESGALEYNGPNLFFTPGSGVRNTVFFGTSGAAAPGLTATPVFTSFYGGNTNALGDPNSWASVVIAGTTFKIPLYT